MSERTLLDTVPWSSAEGPTGTDRSVRVKRKKVLLALFVLCVVAVAAVFLFLRTENQSGVETMFLASDFSLTDINGNVFSLSDFRGKVVIVDFMATWCNPCRQQIPQLRVVWEKQEYKDKVVILSIDVDPSESDDALEAFMQNYGYASWIWARDTAHLQVVYHVTTIPKTAVVDRDGYVRFTHVGVASASSLIEEVDRLLG